MLLSAWYSGALANMLVNTLADALVGLDLLPYPLLSEV